MDAENEQKVIRLLTNKFNRWWTGVVIDTPLFKRSDFQYIYSLVKEQKSMTLVGPRQVGKTTILMQIIKELLLNGIPSVRICYADMGDIELLLTCPNPLYNVLDVYRKYILQEDFISLNSAVYLFFDEVQRDPAWAETTKSFVDHYPHLHLFCTGSSSMNVSQRCKETLPGRSYLQVMLPLKFVDVLRMRYLENSQKINAEQLRAFGKEMRNWFVSALSTDSLENFVKKCIGNSTFFISQESEIQAALDFFLSRGGYPGVVLKENTGEAQRLLISYANDVLAKDLAVSGGLRNIDLAEKILYLLAATSGTELNKQGLIKRIPGSNFLTVNKYISFFRELSLINEIPIYSGSRMGSTKYPKLYFQDVGLRNALCGLLDAPFSDTDRGLLAETIACDHIERLSFKLNNQSRGHVYCYRDLKEKNTGGETDFILKIPSLKREIPIESKFRRNIHHSSTMYEFLSDHKQPYGIILTRDTLKYDENTAFVPLWMFALMC